MTTKKSDSILGYSNRTSKVAIPSILFWTMWSGIDATLNIICIHKSDQKRVTKWWKNWKQYLVERCVDVRKIQRKDLIGET